MKRYVLGWKTEPSPCGSFCPCNTDYDVSEEDHRAIEEDVQFERMADAASGGDE